MRAETLKSQSVLAHPPLLRQHMPELDTLRGIAILLVLFYHGMAPPLPVQLSGAGRLLFSVSQYGWVGVNVFFVLSGFLITGILLDSNPRASLRDFYVRRALRIFPALYFTLLVLLASRWISWKFALAGAFFVANYAPLMGIPLQYGPLWSLAVEEHFYLIWPWMMRRLHSRNLVVLLAAVVVASPALRVIDSILHGPPSDYIELYTWFNLDGLAIGALLGLWLRCPGFRREHLERIALPVLLGGTLTFLLLLNFPPWDKILSGTTLNLASGGLLGCMLIAGTSRLSYLVTWPVLRFFGYISYGLYLVHVLAFRIGEAIFERPLSAMISSGYPTAAMLMRFATGGVLAIVLAFLSRRSLEEYFLRIGRNNHRTA